MPEAHQGQPGLSNTSPNRLTSLAPTSRSSLREALTRFAWLIESPVGLAVVFCAALLLRIAIAPHFGFFGDIRLFQQWVAGLREVGMHDFYAKYTWVDYPPGYLYLLWIIAKLSAAPGYLLMKTPAIIADLVLAWLAGISALRLAPPSLLERAPVRVITILAVLFNPAVFGLSAGWGQVDAIPVCFMLGSFILVFTEPTSFRRDVIAALLFGIAFSIKPQTSLAFPVIAYALYERYFHAQQKSEIGRGVLKVLILGACTIVVWLLSALPFNLSPAKLLHLYQRSSGLYPVTSVNAYNFWAIIGMWRPDAVLKPGAETIVDVRGIPPQRIAGITAANFGLLIFLVAIVYVVWRVHREIQRGAKPGLVLFVGAAVLSLAGYTFLTRMHERYMFLALASFAPLVFIRSFRLTYAALSAVFLLNLWFPYAEFNSQWQVSSLTYQPWFDWIEGGIAPNAWQKKFFSLIVTGITIGVALIGMRRLSRVATVTSVPERPAPPLRVATPRKLRKRSGLFELAEAAPSKGWLRFLPVSIVGLTSIFALIILRGETKYAENLNDSALHLLMVRWASGQLHEGRVPFDGWFPYFSLGSSFFHHYQSLPHIITGLISNVIHASTEATYVWMLYLLLALWPISVYVSARLLEWSKWTAAAAAAVSLLIASEPGYGFEIRSYLWEGYGVYSQEWGMWLLPLAWGFTWRAVARGEKYAAAAAALAFTVACHFITGYLALLTIGVWVIVLGKSGFGRRLLRAAVVAGGSLLVAAWVIVPLLTDMKYSAQSEYYKGSIFSDSYGASRVLRWLFTGQLFDKGRFPVMTLCIALGVIVCVARFLRDPRARAILAAFVLSLVLFFGRPTLGPILNFLPGFQDIQIHRFVMGSDLAGIMLAGIGIAWMVERVYSLALRYAGQRRFVGWLAAASVAFIVLAIPVRDTMRYAQAGKGMIGQQQVSDRTDGRDADKLVEIVRGRNDGRVYAGLRGNWGRDYRVGNVPMHAWLANRELDAIGFSFRTVTSLSTDIEAAFDENNPAQYEMMNVRYVILPPDRSMTVPAQLLMQSGRHRLYELATSGYFQVVDRGPPVFADRKNIEQATLNFRRSTLASQNIYPGVAFDGATPPSPTFSGESPAGGSPGHVLAQTQTLRDGVFNAAVEMTRPATVLLKATYDPRWTATVDGKDVKPVMMAPSLVGVDVPAGVHAVVFRYKPYGGYPLLLLIGALTLAALIVVPRRLASREKTSETVEKTVQ